MLNPQCLLCLVVSNIAKGITDLFPVCQKWIPSVGRMPFGPYFVNFGHFYPIFDPLWGFSVKYAC